MPSKKVAKSRIEFDNEEEEETLRDFMKRKLNDGFVENIPLQSIRDLPTRYMYLFGAYAYVIAISCFMYFTYIGYNDLTKNAFLSLDPDSGDCIQVTREVSGVYVGDSAGNWAGVSDFRDEYGLYRLELNNFDHTDAEFTDFMQIFGRQLKEIGQGALTRSLADNLVFWMTWQPYIIDGDNIHKFGMNSDPIYVFDRSYIGGGMGSTIDNCALPSVTDYDRANGVVSFSYTFTDFMQTESCKRAMNPVFFGYLPEFDGNTFTIKLDVTAFATAVAVNNGVLPFHTLIKIPGLAENVISMSDGSEIHTSFRYHPQYPGMVPLVCIEYVTAVTHKHLFEACTVKYGQTIAYPTFHHFGYNQKDPRACTCDDTNGYTEICNRFDFLNGLLFFSVNHAELSFLAIVTMILKFGGSQKKLSQAAYDASWSVGGAADADRKYLRGEWREQAFDFCRINLLGENENCSFVTFHLNDLNLYTVSDKYFQVNNGSCQDTFYVEGFEYLSAEAPSKLTQDYFECVATPLSALFDSVGIASGNTSLMVPIGLMCLLPLLYMYLQATDKLPPKEEYTTEERRAASEALALLMLRFRDGKTRGMKQKGILAQLTAELVSSAKVESGFPDSDDDSDDEVEGDIISSRGSFEHSTARRSITKQGSKRLTPEDEELNKKLLAEQELRHHRRSVIFVQKRAESTDTDSTRRGSLRKRGSARRSTRRSDAMALREKLKRKSALSGGSSTENGGGWTSWFGWGGSPPATSGNTTANPMSGQAVQMSSIVSVSKRRSQIESGDIIVLNFGKSGHPSRRTAAIMPSDDVSEFLSDLKKDMNKALAVIDVDGGAAMFRIASKKSVELSLIPVRMFDVDEQRKLFSRIFTILTIHGAVALRLPLDAIATTQIDHIAYIIGTKLFTAREVKAISSGDCSVSDAGISIADMGDISSLTRAV